MSGLTGSHVETRLSQGTLERFNKTHQLNLDL